MREYESYFDEAGPDNEDMLLHEMISPARQIVLLERRYRDREEEAEEAALAAGRQAVPSAGVFDTRPTEVQEPQAEKEMTSADPQETVAETNATPGETRETTAEVAIKHDETQESAAEVAIKHDETQETAAEVAKKHDDLQKDAAETEKKPEDLRGAAASVVNTAPVFPDRPKEEDVFWLEPPMQGVPLLPAREPIPTGRKALAALVTIPVLLLSLVALAVMLAVAALPLLPGVGLGAVGGYLVAFGVVVVSYVPDTLLLAGMGLAAIGVALLLARLGVWLLITPMRLAIGLLRRLYRRILRGGKVYE